MTCEDYPVSSFLSLHLDMTLCQTNQRVTWNKKGGASERERVSNCEVPITTSDQWVKAKILKISLHTIKWLNSSIWPTEETLTGTATPSQNELGSNGKGYSILPKGPGLKPYHQMV